MATILIIDDDKHIRFLLRTLLEKLGHTIIEATNGKEALAALQIVKPSMLIVDIFMPEMDGIELIRSARRQETALKIIAISGSFSMKDVEVLEVARRLGATYTLQKPFEVHTLIDMVHKLLPSEPVSTHPT